MVPDEPVRGRPPPPWFRALDGVERMRASARGQIPMAPLSRLLGVRPAHVTPGGLNTTMPATEASMTPIGQLEIVPLMMIALEGATHAAVGPGMDVVPLKFVVDPFRPSWPRPGNLIARARVVNAGRLFVFAEVAVEDPEGRHLGQASLQSAVHRLDPPPPPPPEDMPAVEEPVYGTPDPHLRSFGAAPEPDRFERQDGLTIVRGFLQGRRQSHVADLFGVEYEAIEQGRVVTSIPASEWFCAFDTAVSPAVLAGLADMAAWATALTFHRPGDSMVGVDGLVRFLRPVAADGRRIRAECTVTEQAPNVFVADTRIQDASGALVAMHTGSLMRLDASQRVSRRDDSKRVLATLLFTDIVESTAHAERLGDSRWQALLEEHRLAVRREVSRHNGVEIDTAGDGFFVRFDSPARAIEAARAVIRATALLGLVIRAGIHTGECELHGNRIAGMAVHVAARIQAAAGPGEVLVSSTVRDLTTGSALSFEDRGEQVLKGVPTPHRLWAVAE